MKSIWDEDLIVGDSPKLVKSDETFKRDVIVVGGGIAGFLCAYMLSSRGEKVTLIEAERLFSGVTKNTTAHINALQGEYRHLSRKNRKLYLQSQIEAVEGIAELVKKYDIKCDFKRRDSYLFANTKEIKDLKKEYKALKEIGAVVEYTENNNLPFGVFDTVKMAGQASFNPIKFLQGLPTNFEVIENTRITNVNLSKKKLKAEKKEFYAKKIIFASNFPVVNIRGLYAFKMYKSSSYAVFAKTDKPFKALYNSINGDGLTYREADGGVVIGGLDHRTGRAKVCTKFDILKSKAAQIGGEVTHSWSANDCLTFDKIPYAGRFRRFFSKDIYVVTGFSKWGMTNSYICAKVIAGENLKYKKLFSPLRFLPLKVFPSLIFDLFYKVFNIMKLFTLKIFGKGVRCPHMSCSMKFNKNTGTWDCPCHGSRLDKTGKIIVGPTVKAGNVK